MANRPGKSTRSGSTVQQDIRIGMAISSRSKRKTHTLLPRRQTEESNTSEPANVSSVSKSPTVVASTSKQPATPVLTEESRKMLENTYAQELFFRYTNIKEVIAKHYPKCSEKDRQYCEKYYYSYYVAEPKYRIRVVLEEVRFDTRYHEGQFCMALKMPITSAEDHEMYNRKLARAGVKECFVDMTQNNRLLEYQEQVITRLKQKKSKTWSRRLDNLPMYLMTRERKRELEDQNFLSLLKHHSTLKDSWTLNLPDVLEQLVQEARLPSEKRKNLHWITLTFDDDALNKQYSTGVYSKFQDDVDIEPEELVDFASLYRTRTQHQNEPLPDSMSFTPDCCSTQDQARTTETPIACGSVASASSQATSQQPATSVTVVPSVPSVHIKEEIFSQANEASGYEEEVEILPSQDDRITIDDSEPSDWTANFSDFKTPDGTTNVRITEILTRLTDHNVSPNEGTASCNSWLAGRLNRPKEAEQPRPVCPPRIGTYVTIEARRNPKRRQTLFTTTTTRPCHLNSYMVFLNFIDIQSIRYTNIPTTWPQCNVFQQNQLTINLNPGCAGLFSVPIRDQQACQLLGLSAGGKGREALLAALAHVGKFRCGRKEPANEYYRLSVTEKILHLFFATFPTCPQNGGYVMFPKSKSSLPADGDEVWLECFNYYAHAKAQPQQQEAREPMNGRTTQSSRNMMVNLLLPGIAQQMKNLREKLMAKNGLNA